MDEIYKYLMNNIDKLFYIELSRHRDIENMLEFEVDFDGGRDDVFCYYIPTKTFYFIKYEDANSEEESKRNNVKYEKKFGNNFFLEQDWKCGDECRIFPLTDEQFKSYFNWIVSTHDIDQDFFDEDLNENKH